MKNRDKGFSLLEMIIVMAILMIVMGVVFEQVSAMQKTNRTEEMKTDLTQEGREFADQFARDLHQSGYPNAGIFETGVLVVPAENDSKNAVGLVKFAYDEVWLEADVNGDGTVDSINYKLQTASGSGQCPCKISRGWVVKAINTAPTAQAATTSSAYKTELQNVANSGGANGGSFGVAGYTIYGNSPFAGVTNDTLYASYKDANVFTAYNAAGIEVAPADYSTTSGRTTLASIKNIRINMNLIAEGTDLQTRKRPVITFSTSAKVGNN